MEALILSPPHPHLNVGTGQDPQIQFCVNNLIPCLTEESPMFFPTVSTPQGPPQVRRQGLQERVRGNSSSLLASVIKSLGSALALHGAPAPEPSTWVCWQQAGH